ncbi:hypothetical protein M8J75_013195 [Diaphorina citri]|nr:hypothetical protein M8J75_013195 [Diaphorina citri]
MFQASKQGTFRGPTKMSAEVISDRRPSMTPIQQFYDGANILITGGTGFFGRVLLSKLLSDCPGVNKIYLLIREKRGKTSRQRFEEIFEGEVS